MNPVEKRLHLTDRELFHRFSQSPTLAKFMQTLPDVRFDEDEARREVHNRNSLRQASNFSQLNIEQEVAHAKCAYFSKARDNEFDPPPTK